MNRFIRVAVVAESSFRASSVSFMIIGSSACVYCCVVWLIYVVYLPIVGVARAC